VSLKAKRPFRRRATIARGIRPTVYPTFTETFEYLVAGSQLATNAGGVIAPKMTDIPELANYVGLYRSFRINKIEVMYLGQVQTAVSTGATNVLSSVNRIALAADRSAIVTAPAAEVDVLNDDGVVIKQLDKLVKFSVTNPVPNLTMNAPGVSPTATAGVSLSRDNWLSFDDATAVPHNGLSYWISGNGQLTTCYVKITFQCCDPK
jgi:hypothetical protein